MERKKDETKHKTLEVLSVAACFVGIIALFGWGVSLPGPRSQEQKARNYAKILGYSIWQIALNKNLKPESVQPISSRGPASTSSEIGFISRDPWGHPYVYNFKYDKQLLFIWSQGPNGKNESHQLTSTFQGDDLGYVLDLKMKQ